MSAWEWKILHTSMIYGHTRDILLAHGDDLIGALNPFAAHFADVDEALHRFARQPREGAEVLDAGDHRAHEVTFLVALGQDVKAAVAAGAG